LGLSSEQVETKLRTDMGFFGTIFGFFGFGIGISIGFVIGYFLFIYVQPTDVKVRSTNKT